MIPNSLMRAIQIANAALPFPSVTDGVYAHYRFTNNELIDEVTEIVPLLAGNATLSNDRITVPVNGAANYAHMNSIVFDPNEDFSITHRVNFVWNASVVSHPLLGVWMTDAGASAWQVYLRTSGSDRTLSFIFKNREGIAQYIHGTTPVTPGVDHHVEVSRVDGVIYLFLDGKLEAQFAEAGGTYNVGTFPRMRTHIFNTGAAVQSTTGSIWAISITKGVGGHTENFTPELLGPYARPVYTEEQAAGITAQYGMRRNSLRDESRAGYLATITGGTIIGLGHIRTGNTNADQYSFPTDYFGADDFTIEFSYRLTTPRSATTQLLGQAYSSAQINNDNVWNTAYDGTNLLVGFWRAGVAASTTISCGALAAEADSHIVIERVDGVITVYVDRVARNTLAWPYPLVVPTTNTMTSNNKIAGATNLFGAKEIWNIRTAKYAIYRGNVKLPATFPALPNMIKPSVSDMSFYYSLNGNASGIGAGAVATGQLNTFGTVSYVEESPYLKAGTKSLNLNGSGGLYSANGPLNGSGVYSIGGWIRPRSLALSTIMQQRDADITGQWTFAVDAGRLWYWDFPNGLGTDGLKSNANTIVANEWVAVGFSRSAAGVCKLYIAGEVVATKTVANNVARTDNGFSIGYDQRDNGDLFNGEMRDLFGFNSLLSDSEFRWIAKSGKPLVDTGTTDVQLSHQYRFADGEAINEVTEQFAKLNGGASVAAGQLKTVVTADTMSFDTVLFTGQPFTVQTKFNYTSTSANMGLIGVWNGSGNALTRWYLLWENNGRKMNLYFRNATQTVLGFSVAKPVANTDHHVEVGYDGTTLYMFLNGVLIGSVAATLANVPASGLPETEMIGGGNTFNGLRWDTSIHLGRCLHTSDFVVESLVPYVHAVYDEDTNSKIVCQVALRRDHAINEANGAPITFSGNELCTVKQGKLVTTTAGANNFFRVRVEKFGASDFTIEFETNLSAVHATNSANILGHWEGAGVATDGNRWAVFINASGQVSFSKANSAASMDFQQIQSAAGAFTFNRNNKVVVERIGSTVTVYVNNVSVVSGAITGALRGEAPFYAHSLSNQNAYTLVGSVWNIRIADKALYNGNVRSLLVYPKMIADVPYTSVEEADIRVLHTFRDGAMFSQQSDGVPISLFGTATAAKGLLSTTYAQASRFTIPVTPFGAGNFTIECKFTLKQITASVVPILCQWVGATSNSWSIYVNSSTLNVGLTIAPTNGTTTGSIGIAPTAAAAKLALNREFHVVVERIGTTVSLYLNRVLLGTVECAYALPASAILTNNYTGSTSTYAAADYRDIRIAARALYNGVVTSGNLKEFRVRRPSLVSGNSTTAVGTLSGAGQNMNYGGINSIGVLSHTLFRDVRTPGVVKVVRLVGLVLDRSTYTVLIWRDTNIVPTDDMPQFTNSLKINGGATLDLATATAATAVGANSVLWAANHLGAATAGRHIYFEFV